MDNHHSESPELDEKIMSVHDLKNSSFLQLFKSRLGAPVSYKDSQFISPFSIIPDTSYLVDQGSRIRNKKTKTLLGEKSYIITIADRRFPLNSAENQILVEGGYIDLMGSIFRSYILKQKLMSQKTSVFPSFQYFLSNPLNFTHGRFALIELQFYKQALLVYLHSCFCFNCHTCLHPICIKFLSMVVHIKKCTHTLECRHPFCLFGRLTILHCALCNSDLCQFCKHIPSKTIELCKLQTDTNQNILNYVSELMNVDKSTPIEEKLQNLNLCLLKRFQQTHSSFFNEFVDSSIKPSITIDSQKYLNELSSIVSGEKCMDLSDSFLDDPVFSEHVGFYERYVHSRVFTRDNYAQSLQMISSTFEFLYKLTLDIRLEKINALLEGLTDVVQNSILSRDLSYGFNGATKFEGTDRFTSVQIRDHFAPIITELHKLPDSYPFHMPVDPYFYDIPDYYNIIKYPMDLSVIANRLNSLFYYDPWEVIHDVNQMFSNAWVYNRRNSKIYKMTTRLYDVFNEAVEPLKDIFHLCCTKRKLFVPQQLFCIGRDYCVIQRDQLYYQYSTYYIYCESCFKNIKSSIVEIPTEDESIPDKIVRVEKSLFKKYKNTSIYLEPFVECTTCHLKVHQICVLYFPEIQGSEFICKICIRNHKYGYLKNYYVSKRLPSTASSEHIEKFVNDMLRSNGCDNQVTIRLVCNDKRSMEVKDIVLNRFHTSWPRSITYQSKTYYAFETLPCGNEICFFGLHVQEYGNDCPEVNRCRIYLSYLDSIHFFQPRELRTAVYYHIILAYFDFCRLRNFKHVHIWSCPPCENDDYIFHCHPIEQKVPNHTRLVEWYDKLLKLGLEKNIFSTVESLQTYIKKYNNSDLTKLPYFDGDYWPNAVEDALSECKNGGSCTELENIISNAFFGVNANIAYSTFSYEDKETCRKGKRGRRQSRIDQKASRIRKGKDGVDEFETVEQKLEELMDRFKDSFFVAKLNNEEGELKNDEDKLIHSDLTYNRSGLLQICREKKYEFSTLQRTMFATIGVLIELHTQFGDRVVYSCNNCKCHLFKKYHCLTCPDFDLCVRCYLEVEHEHELEKQKDDPDRLIKSIELTYMNRLMESKMIVSENSSVKKSEESSNKVVKMEAVYANQLGNEVVESFVHASICPRSDSTGCPLDGRCYGIKLSVAHFISCPHRGSHKCYICRSVMLVAFQHAKSCNNPHCQVFFCSHIQERTRKVAKFRPAIPQRHSGGLDARRRMQSMINQGREMNSSFDENSNNINVNQDGSNLSLRSCTNSPQKQMSGKQFPKVADNGPQLTCVLSQTGNQQKFFRLDGNSIKTCKFIDPLFFLIDPTFNTHIFPDDIVFYNISKINVTLLQNMDGERLKISIYYLRKHPSQIMLLPPQQKMLALSYMSSFSVTGMNNEGTEEESIEGEK